MLRRKTDPKTREHTLCEPAQSKRTWTFKKSHSVWKSKGKKLDPNPGDIASREPAQSKRTWTFHKSHFVEIYRKNAARAGYHLDQTPGLNCYRKNPFSVATLFGEILLKKTTRRLCIWKGAVKHSGEGLLFVFLGFPFFELVQNSQ